MGTKLFCDALHDAKIGKNDRKWFPKWLRRYAECVQHNQDTAIPIDTERVTRFLQKLRDTGTPAWQRLQAVRAIEAYNTLVRRADSPKFHEFRKVLGRLADRERTGASVSLERELQIDTTRGSEPNEIQALRQEMRLRGKARSTGDDKRRR